MRTIVLDASIVLNWFFSDEASAASNLSLLEEFFLGHTRLIAPRLLEYEVLNGLLTAGRRGRLETDLALTAWRGFRAIGLELFDIASDGEDVIRIAEHTGLTAYDGAYLALALKEKAELATTDKALAAAAIKERIVPAE